MSQGDGLRQIQRADTRAAQAGQVGATAQRCADIFGQRAHISAFAAGNPDRQQVILILKIKQLQLMNHHWSRRSLHGLALASILIQGLAIALEC